MKSSREGIILAVLGLVDVSFVLIFSVVFGIELTFFIFQILLALAAIEIVFGAIGILKMKSPQFRKLFLILIILSILIHILVWKFWNIRGFEM